MDEAGLAAIRRAVFDIGPARLEIGIVRDRRDLQPLLAARRPDLDIVGHGCAETDIAGAKLLDPVGQAQPGAGFLGIRAHLLEHGIRLFRLAEDVHLDLVELVAALDAAHIPPGAHLLAPETGRVGGVAQRAGWPRRGFRPCAGRSAALRRSAPSTGLLRHHGRGCRQTWAVARRRKAWPP